MTTEGERMIRFVLELVRMTRDAMLVRPLEPGAPDVWLARSLVIVEADPVDRRVRARTIKVVRLAVPRWLAEQKGLAAGAGAGQGTLFG